ncbi:hypothetical protein NA57DRAFT_44928, partial [Rhizodiscina lignyota]
LTRPGQRARSLLRRNPPFIRILVTLLYVFAALLILSASTLYFGITLSTLPACHATIIVCLIFYVGSKVVMYLFLVERAHALRAPYLRRLHDWMWLGMMFVVITGFGTIAGAAFAWPIAEVGGKAISSDIPPAADGRCRIGIPLKVTVPLLTYDIFINIALTGVFLWLLTPLVSFSARATSMSPASNTTTAIDTAMMTEMNYNVVSTRPAGATSIEKLVAKSLIGAVLVLFPTVVNLVLLYHFKGREFGWLCLSICTLDVTWAVSVVHWLTVDPMEMEGQHPSAVLPRSTARSGEQGAGVVL